jgi:hypothetical protein
MWTLLSDIEREHLPKPTVTSPTLGNALRIRRIVSRA